MQSQDFHVEFWSRHVSEVGLRNMSYLLYFEKDLLVSSITEGVFTAGFYVGLMLLKF